MELKEGKCRLLFEGYFIICRGLMKIAPTYTVGESSKVKIGGGNKKQVQHEGTWFQGIFAWCFFTLGWAMMCCSVTTATTVLTQLS